jgi:hypothetical protein
MPRGNPVEYKVWKRNWKKTLIGKTSTMYDGIRRRSKEKWLSEPEFTIEEFREWFLVNNGEIAYKKWAKSNYNKKFAPSVDRIDCRKKYTFDNMQIITWKENIAKGGKEKILVWGKEVKQIDKDGYIVMIYKSPTEAAKILNCNSKSIQSAARKKDNYNGFRWEYICGEKYHRFNYLENI